MYRDLKPANILLDEHGSYYIIMMMMMMMMILGEDMNYVNYDEPKCDNDDQLVIIQSI